MAILVSAGALSDASAQGIEPRAYSNAPVGVNFLVGGYLYGRGGLSLDPSLPVTNARIQTSSEFFAYVRALDLWGLSAKADAIVPYTRLSGTADYLGQNVSRVIHGFNDPSFRLSVNLYGAPALRLNEFRGYHQDLIVGASLQVTAPWGQYDDTRLLNISTHRWTVKPEVGLSKALDRWTVELQTAVTLYADNDDFYHGHTRSQDALYSGQTHVIYNFPSGIWGSLDATWYGGGRSTLDGVAKNDLQQNWRTGTTLALPVDAHNSVKLNASWGVSARTGNNFELYGIAWQYRFGGGL